MKPPYVIWITGLPAAGKTTIGEALAKTLKEQGQRVEHLDGDRLRNLFPGTGFSKDERNSHIHRVGYLAGMLEKNGVTVVASFISPYRESREFVRNQCNQFIEVYLSTPLEECEKRDPKGLYKKARKGEIKQFTGIDDPYEPPENPEITIDTSNRSIKETLELLMDFLS
ncbi:MAG TPA: adenylyl-sulfate kinase [Bacteroides sp.]|nr:adenylyl-sulfate kinase [Bacteroides sp.]